MEKNFWFNGWDAIEHLVYIGVIGYIALLLMLRISGKRTLSRMTSYDFVITMALGSILGKVLLSADNSVSESIGAMALLISLQWLVSVSVCRWPVLGRFIAGEPTVLAKDGVLIESALRRERISREEICAAIREKGIDRIDQTASVILNTNGDLSVLPSSQPGSTGKATPETP